MSFPRTISLRGLLHRFAEPPPGGSLPHNQNFLRLFFIFVFFKKRADMEIHIGSWFCLSILDRVYGLALGNAVDGKEGCEECDGNADEKHQDHLSGTKV